MFDTTTMTKIVGSLCGSLLVLLLGNFVAGSLYQVGGDGHDQAFVIDTGEEPAEQEPTGDAVDFGALLASADAAAGEKLFKACKACHKVEDGKNGVGPHLYGVVNRSVGSVDGFKYSGSLVAVVETWDADALNAYLENPKEYAPGTKMTYKGMKDVEDRANLIAWLDSLDG